VVREKVNSYFAPFPGPVFEGFERWYGADVAIATGWETAHATMLLGACRARAYVVNDHEPEFFGTSAERRWAEDTYRLGMYCIAASPWLRDLLAERYGAHGTDFELGVDHDLYSPGDVPRRRDTVICYARGGTPRRGVPLAMLALAELHRRRPEVRIVLFGGDRRHLTSFPHEDLGIVEQRRLSWAYSEATVGLTLSLTNFSLIPKEMLACGLPCVEVAGVSAESIFGTDGPLELAAPEPLSLADAMERLLDDPALWERRSRAGVEYVASHTWERATRAEVGARLDAGQARVLDRAQPWERSALTLAFGVHHRVPAVLQKTGLSPADPPGDVHAMGRGALAAGGAYYYADLVVGSL